MFDQVPDPSGSPVPVIVIDVARDPVDWVVLLITAVSTIVGVVAILFAKKANQIARQVESRSVERSVRERRSVFELEILRNLLDTLDHEFDQLMVHPEQTKIGVAARLAMIPEDELAAWRIVVKGKKRRIAEMFDPDAGWVARNDGYINSHQMARPQLAVMAREALRRELTVAIERRMKEAKS